MAVVPCHTETFGLGALPDGLGALQNSVMTKAKWLCPPSTLIPALGGLCHFKSCVCSYQSRWQIFYGAI